jgi:hypothetical protein
MISFLILLIVLGAVLYIVETYVPMAPPFKVVIRVVVVILLLLFLLRLFGIAVTMPPL